MDEDTACAIRSPADDDDVALLERYLPRDRPGRHRERYIRQQHGAITYLVVWHDARPVGHLTINWRGPVSEPMASTLTGCPEIEDFYVDPAFRKRRFGLRLLAAAEALVTARGYRRIGLGVGLTPDYDRARALYLRRGYRSAGFGTYYDGWWILDESGTPTWWEEACEYLVKSLPISG